MIRDLVFIPAGSLNVCTALVLLLSTLAVAQSTTAPNAGSACPVAVVSPQQQATELKPGQPGTQPAIGAAAASAKPVTPATAGELPNAPSAYVPLTKHQKFEIFTHRIYSPYTFAAAAYDATWAQAMGDFYNYGGGMQGWGKRFGASVADTEVRTFFGAFLFPVFFHHDPRYFPSRKKGLIPRAWYAATRVVVTRDDDGNNTFNSSEFLAVAFTASMQNAYYPQEDRGFTDTMSRIVGALNGDATSNVLREFWPDIVGIFRKHEPARVRRLEQKLPMEKIERVTGATPQDISGKPISADQKNGPTGNCANAPVATPPASPPVQPSAPTPAAPVAPASPPR